MLLPGPAPSTREETADVHCGGGSGGSGGARCLSLADYVRGPPEATREVTAAAR